MADRTLDWRDELRRWLKPFLARLGHKARRQNSGRGAFLRAKSGWCCKAGGSRRHEGATIGRCHINLPVQPIRTHFRIRRQERGMAALLDRSLNVLAAAQSNTALGEELLSFAGKFVISR
jgi:hypothetical protein